MFKALVFPIRRNGFCRTIMSNSGFVKKKGACLILFLSDTFVMVEKRRKRGRKTPFCVIRCGAIVNEARSYLQRGTPRLKSPQCKLAVLYSRKRRFPRLKGLFLLCPVVIFAFSSVFREM